jgi:hypothetical protein
MTGESYTGAALLAQDRIRAGNAREALRESARQLTGWGRFVRTATARFGVEGLCGQEDCAAVCREEEVKRTLLPCKGPWLYLSLEMHWRGACLADFPTASVEPLCGMDRGGPFPFIQRHLWAALLTTLAQRFKAEPTVPNEKAALLCRDHYIWRLGQVDAVWIPEERNPSRLPQLCVRVALQDPRSAQLRWASASGEALTVPNRDALAACSTETLESLLETPCGHTQWYSSRAEVGSQGTALWRKRRAAAPPPFPDYDGISASSASSSADDATLSSESSSSESETPLPQSFTGSAQAPGPSGHPRDEAVPAVPSSLTIFEQALLFLPDGFSYITRVHESDAAMDETCAVARANEALVAGFVARSARRVRRRLA